MLNHHLHNPKSQLYATLFRRFLEKNFVEYYRKMSLNTKSTIKLSSIENIIETSRWNLFDCFFIENEIAENFKWRFDGESEGKKIPQHSLCHRDEDQVHIRHFQGRL